MRFRVSTLCFASLFAFGCARGPNISTDQLPLKRVVIYRNGVGYFERSGHVDADAVTFKMRQKMVGDFLASLAIVERGGSSVRSASFPLEVEKDDESVDLDPRYESMLKPFPGPGPKKKDKNPLREVILRLDGKEHDLAIGYVSETPVWRPSYRLVVQESGNADLQTWGIVQNLSGEDWGGVDLVLVAGAPLAFESTLGDPVVPDRPIVTDTGEVIAAVPTGVTSLEQRKESEVERFGGEKAEAASADKDMGGLGLRGVGEGGGGAAPGDLGDDEEPPAPRTKARPTRRSPPKLPSAWRRPRPALALAGAPRHRRNRVRPRRPRPRSRAVRSAGVQRWTRRSARGSRRRVA
ncbi:MAG: hypothetical protein U0263_35550 [Polyangiaceae bacterium]